MSSGINAVKLYQLKLHHDKHRLQINSIKAKSSPHLKKQRQQSSIMSSRHAHQEYNSKFKHRESATQLNRKNNLILNRLQDMSRVSRPNSTKVDKLRHSMTLNRITSKRQEYRSIEKENQRFLRKLYSVKSTINNSRQNSSFSEHMRRSQMLSKFKKDQKGYTIPKNSPAVQKRIKLDPIHKKLQVIQTKMRTIAISKSPLKFNSLKLAKMNPQKS